MQEIEQCSIPSFLQTMAFLRVFPTLQVGRVKRLVKKGVCKKERIDSLFLADNGPFKGLSYVVGLTCQPICEKGCLQERGIRFTLSCRHWPC